MPGTPSLQSASEDSASDAGGDSSAGIGLSAPELNYQVRRKLDAMNKLHNTGVNIDIDLPQIAVIGNQSAGKSSLIEAISGITLPRAAGTCTRCPTECRLARTDAPWQCIVSLRITTDATGKPLGQAKNEQFGDIIYDKSKVEDRIRRAQRAILNPQKTPNYDFFLTEPEGDTDTRLTKQLAFSHNCITLSISGPDVADLSFCDLPGLIASVGRGGDDLSIALVEKMVVSYIQKPSCIILLTVACETDFENQGAHRLAKTYDSEGRRTIGVLTKPDRIPQGEESSWIPFIRDEKEPLENNWFCVKLPSSFELLNKKLTWAQARRSEEDFFTKKSGPWSEVEEPYRKYLGTNNLVERLSTVLSDLIATRVPQIQDELERSIANTRDQISRLPPPPTSDPRSEILTLLHKFVQDVSQHVLKGVPDDIDSDTMPGLIQTIRPEQEMFKRAIRATAPEFWPFEKNATNGKLADAQFLRSEEGDLLEIVSFARPAPPRIYVDDVFERMKRARTRELPGRIPKEVEDTFIRNIIKQWKAPSEALIKAVHKAVSAHLKQMVYDHFHQFGQGKLEQQVRVIVQNHVNACLAKAEYGVKYQRTLEEGVPFTMNEHYLTDYKSKFLTYYKGAREEQAKATSTGTGYTPFQIPVSLTPAKFEFNTIGKADAAKPPAGGFAPATSIFGTSASTSSTLVSGFKPIPPAETPKLAFPPSNAPVFPSTRSTSTSVKEEPAAATASPFAPQPVSAPFSQTPAQHEASVAKVVSGFAEMGRLGVTEAHFARMADPDPMEPALDIMAQVRAYFQVAYKRFVDNVPLAIDVELVRGLEKDLLPTLYAQLGINGPQGDTKCKDYAQENRKIASRRVELTKKLERLEAGHNELFTAFV